MTLSLITNKSRTKNHKIEILDLIANYKTMTLCSGWVNSEGLKLLRPAFKKAFRNQAKITLILSAKNIGRPRSFNNRLKEFSNDSQLGGSFSYYIVPSSDRYVHAKVYLFENDSDYTAIVGSANLMDSGLLKYHEASVKITGDIGDAMHRDIKNYLSSLVPKSKSLSKQLTANALETKPANVL